MIPRTPTPEMIAAAKKAVSGFPRDSAIEAIWQAMWDAAIVDGTATAAANGDLPVPLRTAKRGLKASPRS